MSLSMFDLQRTKYELYNEPEVLNALQIKSNISCYIPKIKFGCPSKWDENSITVTTPYYPKTPITENALLEFKLIPDTNSADIAEIIFDNLKDKELPEEAFWGLSSAAGGSTYYNYIIVDTKALKVFLELNIKAYTFTGKESWSLPSSNMPGNNLIIHPIISDFNTSNEYWPFCGCSHYKLDWAGNFADGTTQGWDIWGTNPDGSLQMYIYNYNFTSPEAYMDYLATLSTTKTPMQVFYFAKPTKIDITNTLFAQELLEKLKPVQLANKTSVITYDVIPSGLFGTMPISGTCLRIKE